MPFVKSAASLQAVPEPASRAALRGLLCHGETAAERRCAAFDLAKHPGACDDLAEALEAEADQSVRQAIAIALADLGTARAGEVLAALLCTPDIPLRGLVMEALHRLGGVAVAPMLRLLQSPDPNARLLAIGVLEGLGDRAARPALRDVLARESDVNVGLAAVEALAQIGAPEDAAALRGFGARFEGEPFVAFAVNLACKRAAAG